MQIEQSGDIAVTGLNSVRLDHVFFGFEQKKLGEKTSASHRTWSARIEYVGTLKIFPGVQTLVRKCVVQNLTLIARCAASFPGTTAQGWTNLTLAVHERVDSRFLVLPGSE